MGALEAPIFILLAGGTARREADPSLTTPKRKYVWAPFAQDDTAIFVGD